MLAYFGAIDLVGTESLGAINLDSAESLYYTQHQTKEITHKLLNRQEGVCRINNSSFIARFIRKIELLIRQSWFFRSKSDICRFNNSRFLLNT